MDDVCTRSHMLRCIGTLSQCSALLLAVRSASPRSLTRGLLLQADIYVARAPGRLDVMGGIAVRSP